MNDRRFLELLNLYLDHQIGPDEANELDAAVHSSPERRRTYEEYCQLQRGCCQLGNTARLSAPAAPRFSRSLRDAERKISAPPRRAIAWYPLQIGAFASVAVAVGFTLVVFSSRSQQTVNEPVRLTRALNIAQPTVVTLAPAVTSAPSRSATGTPIPVHPALAALSLAANLDAVEIETPAPDREALAWMQRVDQLSLQALVVDEQAFASRTMVAPEVQALRRPRYQQPAVQFTGFQFQR